MNKSHLLSVLLAASIFTLIGCNGNKSDTQDIAEDIIDPITPAIEVDFTELPIGYYFTGCVDANLDLVCDEPEENIEDMTVLEGTEGLLIVSLNPAEDIGVSEFATYGGKRVIVSPISEKSVTAYDSLAWGLLLFSQELQAQEKAAGPLPLGLGAIILVGAITNIDDAKDFLKKYYNLDGSKQQNEAIFQAMNINLELLGEQDIELEEAIPADIKAMAESLVNLTIQGSNICIRIPSYCEDDDSDDPYPPINLADLEPVPRVLSDAECVRYEYGNCVEWVGPLVGVTYPSFLIISKDQAVQIAYDIRKEANQLKSYEQAFDALQCGDTEFKTVVMQGNYDQFDATNTELTAPTGSALNYITTLANYGINVLGYDEAGTETDPAVFIETISGVPNNITQASFIIGLIENRYTLSDDPEYSSLLSIGDFQSSTGDFYSNTAQDVFANWTAHTNDVYAMDASSMNLQNGNDTLLTRFQNGQQVDVLSGYLTNVDFVAVAYCQAVPADEEPEAEEPAASQVIKEITSEFQGSCKLEDNAIYMELSGGEFDDFTGGMEPVTPNAALSPYAGFQYDDTADHFARFMDSLPLSLQGYTVLKAQFSINIRQGPYSTSYSNPYMAIGDSHFGIAGYHSNVAYIGATESSPHVTDVSVANGGTLRTFKDTMLFRFSSPTMISFLDVLNYGTPEFNILALPNLEVDGTLLQMCVTDVCVDTDRDGYCDDVEKEEGSDPTNPNSTPLDLDGDGVPNDVDCNPTDPLLTDNCDVVSPASCEAVQTIALHDAMNWTDTAGSNPTVHNEFQTYPPNPAWANSIWDGDMDDDGINNGVNDTWFNFGYASNTTHKLNQEFCACGDVKINIVDMKSDNTGYVDINNLDNLTGHRIVSRTANSQATMASWGVIESGSWSSIGNGTGVNYDLEFGVKNYSGPSGGAIQGTLEYTGHPGACTVDDIQDTGVVIDNPFPIMVEGEASVVSDISWSDGSPVGTGGTATFEVAGPVIAFDDIGRPFVDVTPSPIIVNVSTEDKVTVTMDPDTTEEDDIIPTKANVVIGCDNGNVRIAWLDSGGFHSHTTSIGCSGSWMVSF